MNICSSRSRLALTWRKTSGLLHDGKGWLVTAPLHSFETSLPKEVVDLVKAKEAEIMAGKFRVEINEKAPAESETVPSK
ncbi:MAG: hypothetical protein U0528_20520 [Anaerolineae bacterium]